MASRHDEAARRNWFCPHDFEQRAVRRWAFVSSPYRCSDRVLPTAARSQKQCTHCARRLAQAGRQAGDAGSQDVVVAVAQQLKHLNVTCRLRRANAPAATSALPRPDVSPGTKNASASPSPTAFISRRSAPRASARSRALPVAPASISICAACSQRAFWVRLLPGRRSYSRSAAPNMPDGCRLHRHHLLPGTTCLMLYCNRPMPTSGGASTLLTWSSTDAIWPTSGAFSSARSAAADCPWAHCSAAARARSPPLRTCNEVHNT